MSDKILVVTPPDDTFLQGIRIVHINLSDEHSSIVSNALLTTTLPHNIINYVWKVGNTTDWLFDKIQKSNLIIFNADESDILTGYVAGKHNSYYFGNLKELRMVNDRAIYTSEDISTLLENISKNYE